MARRVARFSDATGRAASRLLAWVDGPGWRGALLLTLLCAALYLPGLAPLPPTDRDEARFMQAARQMAQSGDLVDIRFQDEPRWKKPA